MERPELHTRECLEYAAQTRRAFCIDQCGKLRREREAASPDDIRALGWSVAVHNDYRMTGKSYTFWLFTKGNLAVKGEGHSDAVALGQIRMEIQKLEERGFR